MPRSPNPSRSTDPLPDTADVLAPIERATQSRDIIQGADPVLGFEAAMQELDGIVAQMESGKLTLDQSLAAYRRGAELLQLCQGVLKDAQQQVKILEEGLLKDFGGGEQPD